VDTVKTDIGRRDTMTGIATVVGTAESGIIGIVIGIGTGMEPADVVGMIDPESGMGAVGEVVAVGEGEGESTKSSRLGANITMTTGGGISAPRGRMAKHLTPAVAAVGGTTVVEADFERTEKGAIGEVAGGAKATWGRPRGDRPRPKVRFRCHRGGGRRLGGTYTLLDMNSTPPCKRSRLVCGLFSFLHLIHADCC
jgi:hypothetical protein